MLEEQICKSANRCQRSVVKINSRAEQKSSESGFKSSSYGGRAGLYDKKESGLNPLSPNWYTHTNSPQWSPYISFKNFLREFNKWSRHFSLAIILLILITLSLDNMRIWLGENWCWSLLGLKRVKTRLDTIQTELPLPIRTQEKKTENRMDLCTKGKK